MTHLPFTPQIVADVLVVVFFAIAALAKRPRWTPLPRSDRGTTLVFRGCCALTLLALNSTVPSPVTAPAPIAWIGLVAAAGGLARMLDALAAMRSSRARELPFQADSLGNLVFWIGAAAASLNVIAMLTVTVAMLAATGVRLSAETAGSGSRRHPGS